MDVFPVLEVSVASMTFVLGFVSARHHAHLSAARDLVHRLGADLESAAGRASRDRARELLTLAHPSLNRDAVATVTVMAAWVWTGLNIWLALWGNAAGALGAHGELKAAGAVGISLLVTGLGTWDVGAVNQQLSKLRDNTTVGLLASAADARHHRRYSEVVHKATLAASRDPALPWPFAYRAAARVSGSAGNGLLHDARADMHRVIERDPAVFVALFDWFADPTSLDLDEDIVQALLPHLHDGANRLHAARRLRSYVDGALRRQVIGRRGSKEDRVARDPNHLDHAARALAQWRHGNVAEGARAALQISAEHRSSVRDAVVAGGIAHLVGEHDRAHQHLDSLLERSEDEVDDDDVVMLQIACLIGMHLCGEEAAGVGGSLEKGQRWAEKATALRMDDGLLELAKAVFLGRAPTVIDSAQA